MCTEYHKAWKSTQKSRAYQKLPSKSKESPDRCREHGGILGLGTSDLM